MSKKKKVLYHSNHSRLLSGFGKHAKNILKYLCLTGKYDIVELSNGVSQGHKDLEKLPWKSVGGLPRDQESIDRINKDPNLGRSASYGSMVIDDVIKKEKPDIYLGVEDIWGLSGYSKKPWWNKINCMVWTTLDSLPILPEAIKCASSIKHYYVWSSFAEKALRQEGHDHVRTLHGCIDVSKFFKLNHEDRDSLRNRFAISEDDFVIGFVFRNQLRKSVPNLLDGFKIFKEKNPESKAKLLLHSNWAEGWDIPRFIKEKGLDSKDILCTYYCDKCKNYHISSFIGQGINCPYCGAEKSCKTISITAGVSEDQLNEIYNLMDVYCHPFTSGGQEIPIQEAKLCELITLVTDYSCGKEGCSPESGGIPLDWSEYREPGTQFIKASTTPNSIAEKLDDVYNMDHLKKISMGKKSREYVVENYSIESIGSKLEKILDEMPSMNYDFSFEKPERNPNYTPSQTEDNSSWLIELYKNILKVELDSSDDGHKHWMKVLDQGGSRDGVLAYFRKVAMQENQEIANNKSVDFFDIIKNEGNKKALFVLKGGEEDIFMSTALLESFKKTHPDYDLFFACDSKYHEMLTSNPLVYKVIPYSPQMENEHIMLGSGMEKSYFDYYCNLGILTQQKLNYRGLDNLCFDLHDE